MGKQKPTMDWQILDEMRAPRQAAGQTERLRSQPSNQRRMLWWYVGAGLLLMGVGGLWYRADQGAAAYEKELATELQGSAQAELWLAAHEDVALAIDVAADPRVPAWHRHFSRDNRTVALLQTQASANELVVDFQINEYAEDRADVLMTIRDTGDGVSLRQRRFYRHTGTGWLRTAPTVERWGPAMTLESADFLFILHQQDAEVVAAVAPQLDTLYDNLRRDLGLPRDERRAKIQVEISPAAAPGEALLRASPPDHYVVPAPGLYFAPREINDEQLLLQAVVLAMVPNLVDATLAEHGIHWTHAQARQALQLWLLWDLDLPLSTAREPIVQWQLTRRQRAMHSAATPLPAHYRALCSLHNVWLPSPTLLAIPLFCDDQDRVALIAPLPDRLAVVQLEQLASEFFTYSTRSMGHAATPAQAGDAIMLTTLVEYVVSRDGRAHLPDFLTALGQYPSWSTMAPAYFNVSTAEFAAEWRDFLERHYGWPR